MSIFQIAATFFGLFMLYVVNIHFSKKTINRTENYLWTSIWLLFIVISIFPDLLLGLTRVLKFDRVFDLLIVLALMILSTVVFMSYFQQKENSKKLEKFVRKSSLINIKKKS